MADELPAGGDPALPLQIAATIVTLMGGDAVRRLRRAGAPVSRAVERDPPRPEAAQSVLRTRKRAYALRASWLLAMRLRRVGQVEGAGAAQNRLQIRDLPYPQAERVAPLQIKPSGSASGRPVYLISILCPAACPAAYATACHALLQPFAMDSRPDRHRVARMPFTAYKSSLDPEAVHAALEAFEQAWAEIMAVPDPYDNDLARNVLARRIIEAATENGERDPGRLKAYALEGFNP